VPALGLLLRLACGRLRTLTGASAPPNATHPGCVLHPCLLEPLRPRAWPCTSTPRCAVSSILCKLKGDLPWHKRECLASKTRSLVFVSGAPASSPGLSLSAYEVASIQMRRRARSLRQCQRGAWCASSAAETQPVGGRGRSRAGAAAAAGPAPAGSPAAPGAAPGGRCQLCGVTCCWPGGGDPVVDPPAMGDGAPGESCDRVIFICGVSARGRTEFYQARRPRSAGGGQGGGALVLAAAWLPAAPSACKEVHARKDPSGRDA